MRAPYDQAAMPDQASWRVLNACWHVRAARRAEQKRRELGRVARIVRAELERGVAPEVVLYALAIGLYDRTDPRFHV